MRFSARNIRAVELRRTLECVLRKDYASILKKIQPYELIHRAGIKIGFIRRIKQNQRKAAFFGRKQRKQRKRISEKHLASAAEAKSLYVAFNYLY